MTLKMSRPFGVLVSIAVSRFSSCNTPPVHTSVNLAMLHCVPGCPGDYRQHQGRRRNIRIEAAKTRLPSRLNLHSAPLLLAVSFIGGFQTPAGPRRPARVHPAAI